MRVTFTRGDRIADAFMVHDGEDAARTDALHEFMDTVSPTTIWEGCDSGILLWPELDADGDEDAEPALVEPGQLIVVQEDRLVRMTHDELWAHLGEPQA